MCDVFCRPIGIWTSDVDTVYQYLCHPMGITGYIILILILYYKLECGPMPNVMAALPNIGCALCSTPQSLPDAHYLTAVQ